jgi:hypothetical protein
MSLLLGWACATGVSLAVGSDATSSNGMARKEHAVFLSAPGTTSTANLHD